MKILLISQFIQLDGENGTNRSRFKYIKDKLEENEFVVKIVTSRFRELDRKFRKLDRNVENLKLINEIGYHSSISVRRIISMLTFSINLLFYLLNEKQKYDLVYLCVPGVTSAFVVSLFCKFKKIPLIIDVQDLWPEVMNTLLVHKIPFIKYFTFPLRMMINYVYRRADGVVAVSETYLLRVSENSLLDDQFKEVVFIGSESKHSINMNNINDRKKEITIGYIGTIGHSYDLETFVEAIHLLNKSDKVNYRGIVIGDGPLKTNLEMKVEELNANINFTGWKPYTEMLEIMKDVDFSINPIVEKSVASVTNKFGDYLAIGRPMLNGSNNREIIDLVDNYKIGINYQAEDVTDLMKKIVIMSDLPESEYDIMHKNMGLLWDSKFNRANSYEKIIDLVFKVIRRKSEK